MNKQIKQTIITLLSLGLIFLAYSVIWAWTAPTANPPSANVAAPINTSNIAQTKTGDLSIGAGLNYWITKVGDSFALKNNNGEIKFIVGQDGHVGIGTETPNNALEIKGDIALTGTTYIYENDGIYPYGHDEPRCLSCDTDPDKRECADTFSATEEDPDICHDWYKSTGKFNRSARFIKETEGQGGKIKGVSTTDTDTDDTVASKGYVDSRAGGATGFTFFDFGNTGVYLKDGASLEVFSGVYGLGGGKGHVKVESGVIKTRIEFTSPVKDCGWVTGTTASCCVGSKYGKLKMVAKAFAGGLRVYADNWHGDCDTGYSSWGDTAWLPWGNPLK